MAVNPHSLHLLDVKRESIVRTKLIPEISDEDGHPLHCFMVNTPKPDSNIETEPKFIVLFSHRLKMAIYSWPNFQHLYTMKQDPLHEEQYNIRGHHNITQCLGKTHKFMCWGY